MDSAKAEEIAGEFYTQLQENLNLKDPELGNKLRKKPWPLWSFQIDLAKEGLLEREKRESLGRALLALEDWENNIKDRSIEEFVEQYFPGANYSEEEYLKKCIREALEQRGNTDENETLDYFLQIGLDGMRKKLKRKEFKRIFKITVKYFWAVVLGLICIGLVNAIFNVLNTPFERIIIAIILAIYTKITFASIGNSKFFQAHAAQADLQFLKLRELLGKPIKSVEQEVVDLGLKKASENMGIIVVQAVTIVIIDVIALLNVLKAINFT